MEQWLTIVSFCQGVFLLATSFVIKKTDECKENNVNKTVNYIHLVIGLLSITIALLKFYRKIKIESQYYVALVALLAIISTIATGMNTECMESWILVENILECILVIGLGYTILKKN